MMAVYRVLRYQPLSAPAWARGMTPRAQRIALLLFLMNALSLTDLGCTLFAHRLGISESAIEKQMAKAMVMLADYAKAW